MAGVTSCPRCADLITWDLRGACASVGIEHKKSTDEVLRDYLRIQHERDHHGRPD